MAKKLSDEILKLNIEINGNKAKKELFDLEQRQRSLKNTAKELTAQKEKLRRSNKQNSAEWNKVTAEIKQNNLQIKQNETRMASLRKEIGITGLTIRQLKSEQSRLNLVMQNLTPGSTQFKKYSAELDAVNGRLSELRRNGKGSKQSMDDLGNSFSSHLSKFVSTAAVIAGIVFSLNALSKGFAELSDAQSDVIKTTGLTRNQVEELTRDLTAFNTRTPRLELLQLAEEAGRLGKKSTKEILSFVKSADMIKVALGDDLQGDINENLRSVGKMAEQYQVGSEYSDDLGQSMNRLGSAINAVSASGSNQAGFQLDILRRMSGVARSANITADSIIGYAAAADEAGQSQEVTATALNKVIVDMMQDSEKYAKIAGMTLKDFTELLDNDTDEALLRFLAGLKGNNEGMRVMAMRFKDLGVDGDRSVQVLSALANNVDNIREKQELANVSMQKATSLSDEFAEKNNNLAANLEKIGRRIQEAFVGGSLFKGFERITAWLERVTNHKPSEGLKSDLITMNAMFDLLRDTNVETGYRKQLIMDLNENYSEYLPNLIKETDSYEELSKAQFLANEQLQKRIQLLANQEISSEFERNLTDLQKKINVLQLERSKAENNPPKGIGEWLSRPTANEVQREIDLWSAKLKKVEKEYQDFLKGITVPSPPDPGLQAWEAQIKTMLDTYAQLFNLTGDSWFIEYSNSAFYGRMDGYQSYLELKLAEMGTTIKEADKMLGGSKTKTAVPETEDAKKAREARVEGEKKIRDFLQAQYSNEATDLLKHFDEIIALNKKYYGEAHELEVLRFKAKKELNEKAKQEEADQLQAEMDAIIEEGRRKAEIAKMYTSRTEEEVIQDEYQTKLDELEAFHEEGLIMGENYLAAKDWLEEFYHNKQLDRQDKEFDELRKARQRQYSDLARYADTARGAVDSLIQFELNGVEDVTKRKGESEEDFTRRKEIAEKERREIQKKYAVLEGLTSISQIGINTLEAISRLPADLPYPVALLLKGIVIAQGVAQAAAATAQVNKIRSYGRGMYPVLDQNGDRYLAQKNNALKTGLYKSPTVSFSKNMLVAEKQPEIVVDGLTTAKLRTFRPDILQDIYAMAGRTPGYANGKYPQVPAGPSQVDLNETNELLRAILASGNQPSIAILPEETRRRMRQQEELERIIREQAKLNS